MSLLEPPKPKVVHDFEFHFLNGARDYIQCEEGRDVIRVEKPDQFYLVICHQDGAREVIEIQRSALASWRHVVRTVQPEPKAIDELVQVYDSQA